MANQIQVTVVNVGGVAQSSSLALSFATDSIIISNETVATSPTAVAKIQYFYAPFQSQIYYVTDTFADLITAANTNGTSQVQVTAYTVNGSPQRTALNIGLPALGQISLQTVSASPVNTIVSIMKITFGVSETAAAIVTAANAGGGGTATIYVSAPITGSGILADPLTVSQATTSTNGYLNNTDWNTFNNKAGLSSPTFTGTPVLPTGTTGTTQSASDNSTKLATTAYADAIGTLKANIASPTFTGTPLSTTAALGTNTTQIATTAYVQANQSDYTLLAFRALGSVIAGQTVGMTPLDMVTGVTLVDNQQFFTAVYMPLAKTLTGIKVMTVTQGSYTADQNNRIGFYTYSAGTLTLVASSSNDGTVWKGSSDSLTSIPFSSTYAASPGIYFVSILYNNSAQVTAPRLGGGAGFGGNTASKIDFTNSAKLFGTLAASNDLSSPSVAMSSISTLSTSNIWIEVY